MTVSANDIWTITKSVTKEWTKQRKAEDRGSRTRACRAYVYSDRVAFTDVADEILPIAYQHASGDGNYTVSKRQLFYACRESFKNETGRELDWRYFSNTLLVQYLNRHPETNGWKITADPRGNLSIPNCGRELRVPCGTIQMESHLSQANAYIAPFENLSNGLRTEWPSLRADQRYQAVLYIEKEGFEPQLNEARIAERFDLAILSCKGQSVVAARRFVDEICKENGGVPLFVVHDFDKSGFEISQRLTTVSDWAEENDRVTYRFKNEINVADLGLRLSDVEAYQLAHETCEFKGRFGSDSICTEQEQQFLRSDRRVELNAFTSPEFIAWIESKLNEHGLGERLIPDDKTLVDAHRRAVATAHINVAIRDAYEKAVKDANSANVPTTLREDLRALLSDSSEPWDKVLYEIVRKERARY